MPVDAAYPMTLGPRQWYAWHALGSGPPDAPWRSSPMFVVEATPLKSGQGWLALTVLRPVMLGQPTLEHAKLRVRYRSEVAVLGRWQSDRVEAEALVTSVSITWLRQYCPWLITHPGMGGWQPELKDSRAFLDSYVGCTPEQITGTASSHAPTWQGKFPPARRIREMPTDRTFSGVDALCLLRGFVPKDMNEKWFVRTCWTSDTTGSLLFFRSWTGCLIWEGLFTISDGILRLTALKVNLDRKQYHYGSPPNELQRFVAVAASLTPGQQFHWPEEENISPRRKAALWHKFPLVDAA